tara:strand:+ start:6161 stop:6433 length:273 start_codon:yes stop_codon:yes gene_type:complete
LISGDNSETLNDSSPIGETGSGSGRDTGGVPAIGRFSAPPYGSLEQERIKHKMNNVVILFMTLLFWINNLLICFNGGFLEVVNPVELLAL